MYSFQPPEVGDSMVITTTEKKDIATAVVTGVDDCIFSRVPLLSPIFGIRFFSS
jgi:hypothetical protein